MKRGDLYAKLAWGIELRSPGLRAPVMIFESWSSRECPPEAPSRTLLFRTRKLAYAWCKAKRESVRHTCPKWRFRPVRVRESWEVLP